MMPEWKKRRTKQLQRRLTVLISMTLLATIAFTSMTTVMLMEMKYNKANAQEEVVRQRYYTSYDVRVGDTIDTIANKYCPEDSIEKFTSNVLYTNHLSSTDEIVPGMSLIVYYYVY